MRFVEEINTLIDAGQGKVPCDLMLKDVQLVNVFAQDVYQTNIYIKDKRIVSIDPSAELEAKEVRLCHGMYAIPGFIDSHMHFESTMLSPEALAQVIVPQGTTTLCADLMEIANVAGGAGIDCMLQSIAQLPYRMLVEVSSRVPTAPGLETNGAYMGAQEVKTVLDREESVSLGEIDPSKILFRKDEYIQKICDTLNMRKVVNGHAIGRLGQDLNVYASAGISDDHECVTLQEMKERLRVGMKVLIREGSTERNLDALVSGALAEGLSLDNTCFCTDDKHIHEIQEEGHINYNVNRAIALGVDPITAISMATLYAAKHFRMEDEVGSITPGRLADILLCDSMTEIHPQEVYFQGKLVYAKGSVAVKKVPANYPDWIQDTVHFLRPITAACFQVSAQGRKEAKVNVIELIDLQIINRKVEATLPVVNDIVGVDATQDIMKIAVVERYGKTGGVGVGFVKGFTLQQGAVAYSMSHDHHNIVAIGENDADIAMAVNQVQAIKGGLAVVINGEILASMSLPIGGLMSHLDADSVNEQLLTMNEAAKQTGCTLDAPFMTLSFISLPTVPEIGITDMGLIDVLSHAKMPLFVD